MQKLISSLFIAAVLALPLLACTNEEKARSVLDKQGFTEVTFTGYAFSACSEDDVSHTGFRAKNPQGKEVEGVVCCGWLKSCTVRW